MNQPSYMLPVHHPCSFQFPYQRISLLEAFSYLYPTFSNDTTSLSPSEIEVCAGQHRILHI